MMSIPFLCVVIAFVIGVLSLFRSRGTSELGWAVTLLALAELWPMAIR